jgi:spore coat polysaccharide biosynthesis predicted glycosyltransferase SpsG
MRSASGNAQELINRMTTTARLEIIDNLRLTLRCDAGETIGMGHVKRCLGLATWLGTKPTFALADTPENVHEEIQRAGYQTIDLRGTDREQARELEGVEADAILFDIANPRWRAQPKAHANHVKAICDNGAPTIFIDGFKSDAVVDDELASLLTLCVRPYPEATPEGHGRWLAGIDYFILSREMVTAAHEPRVVPEIARRLLVTTGGSDVGALSPRIVRELDADDGPELDVRLIVGPLMSERTRADTAAAVTNSRHTIRVIEGRTDLGADMHWCEMAVSTTGLTKYELALNGVPTILVSPDPEHDENQAYFRDFGAALDLGIAGRLPFGAIGKACRSLSRDAGQRSEMARRGHAILDGKGSIRLLSEIKGIVDARG